MAKQKLNPLHIFWHILRNDIHRLEYDPQTQYHYHLTMTRYWALNFPVIIVLFFVFPQLWVAIALFINTIYSLYANLATDFGAVPASYAALKADEIKRLQNKNLQQTAAVPGALLEAQADQRAEFDA